MASLAHVRAFLNSKDGQEYLHTLYGDRPGGLAAQRERYLALAEGFEATFPDRREVELCSAPGRTEVGGNHTDHENGRVLAAAINLDSVGIAARNDGDVIHIFSEGYDRMEIRLDDLEPRSQERNSSPAMVRGVCQYLRRNGDGIGGFDAVLTSAVPGGSGLSSSASFEILVAHILNTLFNQERLPPLTLAQAGHFAEVEYFNKPCGLMDQATSAVGGLLTLDFADPSTPAMRPVKFDLGSSGHLLVVTETGGSHASLTDEYAAVKEENRTVAQFFGMLVLREVDEEDFRTSIPALRNVVGDRAVLRAIHFFDENRRVLEQVGSLEGGDFNKFLKLVNESGISSWTLLQNCYSSKNATEQGITLGLTLGARILNGRGAWRVHGGGFAGTIQAFVPQSLLNDYISGMEQVFGRGACQQLGIRPVGATRLPVMV